MRNSSDHIGRIYATLLGLVTAVFVVLYFSFLTGEYLYAYYDIGSDTIFSYLPRFIFEIDSIVNHSGSTYSLQWGFGSFITEYILKYLNPVNLPLLLFGTKMIHWGLLISTYLKYALISLFSLLFFRCIIKDDRLAAGCAFLWTFSGYAVLWGQHYQFLTNILCFTICMYTFQLFLDGDRKRILLIPALAFFIYNSYFHFYMSCYFFAGYGLFYLIINHSDFKKILKLVGIFALCAIWGACIAGDSIFPSIMQFFSSTRMDDVTGDAGRPLIYPVKFLLTFLSRLLSNDMLGISDSYSGSSNYYESAILSVSVLFLFMLVFLLQGKQRKQIAIVSAGCAVALSLTPVSHLIGFSYYNQRWTFVYCLLEVIAIGIGLYQYFSIYQQPDAKKRIIRTVLITDGIYAMFVLLLWAAQYFAVIDIKLNSCLILACFIAIYSALLLLLPRWKVKYCYSVLAVIFCLELIVTNYNAINQRAKITTGQWYQGMYYDGCAELTSMIQSQDPSLYRINKTFDSVFYNDALIQGYNGVGGYSSVNSAELLNFANSLDISPASNYVRLSGYDHITNTLLGVKYLITAANDSVDSLFYDKIYSDETHAVYVNKLSLGFGYLYTNQISEADFLSCSIQERSLLLTGNYYLTDGESDTATAPLPDVALTDTIDYTDQVREAENCTISYDGSTLLVQGEGQGLSDMQLFFDTPEIPDGWRIQDLSITFTASESSYLELFWASENQAFSAERSQTLTYDNGHHTMTLNHVDYNSIASLRLDVSGIAQDVEIESIEFHLINEDDTVEQLQQLQENTMTDFHQEGNTFTGSIYNPNQEAMLCIPMIYSNHWSATVDGETAQIYNINGGLIGLSLSEGNHEISITYHDNSQQIGFAIGMVSFISYAIYAVIWWKKQKAVDSSPDQLPG